MKNLILLISLIFLSTCANAQVAGWFTNSDSAGTGEPATFYNQVMIDSGSSTIRVKAGHIEPDIIPTLGEIGDLYLSTSGKTFQKQDAGVTTNWIEFGTAAGNLAALSDTTINSPLSGQVLTYDDTSAKWVNLPPGVTIASETVLTNTVEQQYGSSVDIGAATKINDNFYSNVNNIIISLPNGSANIHSASGTLETDGTITWSPVNPGQSFQYAGGVSADDANDFCYDVANERILGIESAGTGEVRFATIHAGSQTAQFGAAITGFPVNLDGNNTCAYHPVEDVYVFNVTQVSDIRGTVGARVDDASMTWLSYAHILEGTLNVFNGGTGISYDPPENRMLFISAGTDTNLYSTVVEVSGLQMAAGSTINIGTATVTGSGGGAPQQLIEYDVASDRHIIFTDKNYLIAVDVKSGASMTAGTPVLVTNVSGTEAFSAALEYDPSIQKVVLFRNDSDQGIAQVVDVNGVEVTLGTETIFSSKDAEYIQVAYASQSNRMVVTFDDESDGNKYSVSGFMDGDIWTPKVFGSSTIVSSTSFSLVEDWTDFTPTFTGFGTISNVFAQYRKVGQELQVRGSIRAGTVTTAFVQMTIPSGFTIDFDEVPSILTPLGTALRIDAGQPFYTTAQAAQVIYSDKILTTALRFSFKAGSDTAYSASKGNEVLGSINSLAFEYSVPVNE